MFNGKVITVFGGTGTIGSLIVERLLLGYEPKSVRIFSNDENSLWEARQRWKNFENVRFLLGDIRDYERVKRGIRGCDYVFSCAAVKHVPFCEYNPLEAVCVNVIGLNNILNACVEYRIKKVLHISTDKAVEPTTVMGATKMIGERLIQIRWNQAPFIGMVCVRLGNVWGSRGSFIELLKKYKDKKKPIPLTSYRMKRYFMREKECANFIFKAFEEGGKGEIFVPKLKEYKIIDIIYEILGKDYPINIVGKRKGEKFEEQLLTSEELKDAEEHDGYFIIPNKLLEVF